MHELSIADDIVRTAVEACPSDTDTLQKLTIHVGQLSSVVIPSLELCLETVLEDRDLNDVEVNIEGVPAQARCECGHRYKPETVFCECPECGSFEREITSGREVLLDSIEVDDGKNQSQ